MHVMISPFCDRQSRGCHACGYMALSFINEFPQLCAINTVNIMEQGCPAGGSFSPCVLVLSGKSGLGHNREVVLEGNLKIKDLQMNWRAQTKSEPHVSGEDWRSYNSTHAFL